MPTAPVSTSASLSEGPEVGEYRLSYEGFGYTYRIVHCDSPVTEPILILGGSDQTRYSWGRHERWLTPLGSLVTVDLPGFGDSDFLPSEYGVDFLAACTDHLLTELGLGKVNLFAGCYGAGIALRLAQNHPRHLRRLVVQGMAREMPPGFAQALGSMMSLLEERRIEDAAMEVVHWFLPPTGVKPLPRQGALLRLMLARYRQQDEHETTMALERTRRLLAHEWYRSAPFPDIPYLVFSGEYDTLTTPDMVRALAAGLPGSCFTTIKDAGHLVHVQRAEEFCDLLGRFITDQPLDGLPYCTPIERLC